MWTFIGKVMSLLFNMLSRLVITFLPRSKQIEIKRRKPGSPKKSALPWGEPRTGAPSRSGSLCCVTPVWECPIDSPQATILCWPHLLISWLTSGGKYDDGVWNLLFGSMTGVWTPAVGGHCSSFSVCCHHCCDFSYYLTRYSLTFSFQASCNASSW